MLPIVLHHGILGRDSLQIGPFEWAYFGGGIEPAIKARGHKIIRGSVDRTGSIQLRATQLKETILKRLSEWGTPNQRVIILAHSMGGLDARYMISRLDMAPRVAGLVTICTPHRGSSYAEWTLKAIHRLNAYQFMRLIRIGLDGARDMTREAMRRFNEETPDHPDVRYFSISAARPWHRVPPFLMHSHRIVTRLEGANDGVVSVASAQWGEHLGTWPAHHVHAVNRRLELALRRRTGCMLPRYNELLDHVTAACGKGCGGTS
ncbi:MAG TPA: alpha/beta fold hydrolase [Tepidisphaeraceae bacterium]|jgi:triacylglycerol lipase